MAEKRIGLREVRALAPSETVWDAAVPGFGARRQKGNAVAYVLKFRTAEGRQRWHTIGRHGAPWTPDTAREEARRLLGSVAEGADPAAVKQSKRKAATVAELCDLYLADAEAGRLLTRRKTSKKPSTLVTDRGPHRAAYQAAARAPVGRRGHPRGRRRLHARRRRGQDGRQDQDGEEARPCARARRQGHGKPHRGLAGRDLLLCGAPPHARG